LKTYVSQKSQMASIPRPGQAARKRRRRRRRLFHTVILLTLIAIGLNSVYHLLVSKPKPDALQTCPPDDVQSAEGYAYEKPPSERDRKEDFYTILISGVDDGNGGSDTNILVAFDAKYDAIHCVSIPRDTGAYINGKVCKTNSAYNKGGIDTLADTVSGLLGIPVDYTIEVNLKGFVALVDSIDGVDFDVPINMNYDDPQQNLSIHFTKGMQHLDGQEALEVIRFRHNNDGSGYGTEDLGRIGTQQAFLKAVARQTLTISNADKILQFIEIFQQYVDTDLTPSNLAWFGKEAISIGSDSISFSTLDGEWKTPYYWLDSDATLKLVNSYLNPYNTDRILEDLKIPS